jgi:hypothetical protein
MNVKTWEEDSFFALLFLILRMFRDYFVENFVGSIYIDVKHEQKSPSEEALAEVVELKDLLSQV